MFYARRTCGRTLVIHHLLGEEARYAMKPGKHTHYTQIITLYLGPIYVYVASLTHVILGLVFILFGLVLFFVKIAHFITHSNTM